MIRAQKLRFALYFIVVLAIFLTARNLPKNLIETDKPSNLPAESMKNEKEPVILCLVMTRANATDLQEAIIDTWASGCTDLIFLFANQSFTDSKLIERQQSVYSLIVPVEDDWDNTWLKVRAAIDFINSKWSKKFDWLMRIDDDAFVIFENLRSLLATVRPDQPLMLGARYGKNDAWGYIGTGPGILISRKAFSNLMKVFNNDSICATTERTHYDDTELGDCLRGANVAFGKSSDDKNRPRFISISLYHLLNKTTSNEHEFFDVFSHYPVGDGFDCCADEIIGLHYTSASDIRLYFKRMQTYPNSKKNLKLLVTGIETPRSPK